MMRRFTTLCLFVIALTLCRPTVAAQDANAPAPKADGIHWFHDLDAAIAEAKQTGKPLMTYFTFNTCYWCHKLEDDTFSDASVIARSRDFVWVKINRDVTPEPCQRFNVSAYPTLMVVGDEQEKVYRFSGYKLPDAFLPELDEAMRRYKLYREGKDWDFPPPRPERLVGSDTPALTTMKAPSDRVPAGIAFLGDRAFVAHFMDKLYEVDPANGDVISSWPLPPSVIDICTDGKVIYGVTSGWTAGQPIYVIDPTNGEVQREVITKANTENRAHGAKGIEFINGQLVILEGMRGTLQVIDPDTGEIEQTIQSKETWLSGLAFDGTNLITVSKDRIIALDPKSGETMWSIAVNYPLRSVGVTAGDGREVWVMEQPEFGYNTKHERVQVWPRPDETRVYRISRSVDAPTPPGSGAVDRSTNR